MAANGNARKAERNRRETAAEQRQERLRRARRKAGLTQLEPAARLRMSQAFVSQVETGRSRVNERYVCRVLVACGLPKSFGATKRRKKTQDELLPSEVVRMDPETCLLVERGSKRDKELQEKYFWWPGSKLGCGGSAA